MIRYFNMKTQYGVETFDEVSQKDFDTYREFKAELRRLKACYIMAGMNVYISQRKAK